MNHYLIPWSLGSLNGCFGTIIYCAAQHNSSAPFQDLIRELQNSHIDLRISLPTKIIDNHAIPPIDLHIYTWMNHLLSMSYLVLARVAKVEICEISF